MMTGLTRRRRTAQQILLRRACLSKSVSRGQDAAQLPAGLDRERGGIVVLPSLARNPDLTQEGSPNRAVRKLKRVPAASTYRVSGDRKLAAKLPGGEVLRKESRSWGKMEISEDNPNRSGHQSGHSLNPKEGSRGSSRSRNSSSIYPSRWPLTVKEKAKAVSSKGSLDEITHCSCLNRTPYDHKLSTPFKSDNSCQCSIKKRARRRDRNTKVVSVAQTQTQVVREDQSRSRDDLSEDRTGHRGKSNELLLKNRFNSGEELRPVRNPSKSNSENSIPSSKCKVSCSGVKFKNNGGYSPSGSNIETASEFNSNPPSRYSDSILTQIEKVSRPPSLNGSKWSLPSSTKKQECFDAADQDNSCLQMCLSNYNFGENQVRKSSTGWASDDQFQGNCSSNKTRKSSDRNSRMNDSFQGRHGEKCSSEATRRGNPTEQDRVEESGCCKRNREASMSSPRNSEQYLSNDEDESKKCTFIYQSNTTKNGADPVRIDQTYSHDYSTGANPSYHQIMSRKENYPRERFSEELSYGNTQPNQQLDMNQNQRCQGGRPNEYKPGLEIAGTHRYPTNCPHRSRASGPLDRMGGSRGSCRTGNSGRETTRGPGSSEMENKCKLFDIPSNRKCIEAVTQTSEFLMTPRTNQNSANCSHKSDQSSLESHRYSPLTSRTQQSKEMKLNQCKSCGMDMNSQYKPLEKKASIQDLCISKHQPNPKTLHLVKSNSFIFQSDQKQYNLVLNNSVEFMENQSNREAEGAPCGSRSSSQENSNCNPAKSQKSSRNRSRHRSRSRRRNRRTCSQGRSYHKMGNQLYENFDCKSSDSRDQREDKCDVNKILDLLQKTVAGLEEEINKAKGYESGRSNRSGCDPKINKQSVASVDSRQKCRQNKNVCYEPKSKPPCQQKCFDSHQQHNFPKPVCPHFNQFSYQYNAMDLTNPCISCAGHINGENPKNLPSSTGRKASPAVFKCPGNVEIPYRNALGGGYRRTQKAYPGDINEHKTERFPNTEWYGNNHQSNVCPGMTETRYGKDTTQFGHQASKDTELAPCQSMYKADKAPLINIPGEVNERLGRIYKEAEELSRSNRDESYQTENGFKCCNPDCIHGDKEAYAALRSFEPYCEGLHNPDSSRKGITCKDPGAHKYKQSQQRRQSCSPKRVAFAKRQQTRVNKVPRTKRETDLEACKNSRCSDRASIASNKSQHSVNKSNVCKKQFPEQIRTNNTEQTCYKVFDCALCENPKCSKKKSDHSAKSNVCKKQFPDKIRTNNTEQTCYKVFDCALCENPKCSKKKSDHSAKSNVCKKQFPDKIRTNNTEQTCYKVFDCALCENPKCSKKKSDHSAKSNVCKKKLPDKIRKNNTEQTCYKVLDCGLCENPNCTNKKSDHSAKSNVCKKQFPVNIKKSNMEQTCYKVFDCALCENPNCFNKKSDQKRNPSLKNKRICENPQCPDKVLKNIEHRYENKQRRIKFRESPNGPDKKTDQRKNQLCEKDRKPTNKAYNEDGSFNKSILCENPQCPDKVPKSTANRYKKESRFKFFSNPKFSDRDSTKSNCTENRQHEDISKKDSNNSCPRDRPVFPFIHRSKGLHKTISRQGSGRSERSDDDSIETRTCSQNKYPLANCRPCEIETKRNTQFENVCLSPGAPPPICVRNRHNPYITADPLLNSYERHILENFEKYKMEKSKGQKCDNASPFICTSKNQTSATDCNSSCPEETVGQYTEEDSGERRCNCQAEESYEYEDNSKSKSSIFSCCKKPPREETNRNQMVIRPQKETKIQRNPESQHKEKSPSKSSRFHCMHRERSGYQLETPKQQQKQPKQSEKTLSKSSGFLCSKKKEKTTPLKGEKTFSNSSILAKKESRRNVDKENEFPKSKRELEEKSSRFSGLQCRERSPRDKQEKEIPQREGILKKSEKTKKTNCFRKPKNQKERDDELQPSTITVCTNQQKEPVRPVEKYPCGEDQPRKDQESCSFQSGAPTFTNPCAHEDYDNEEVKVLYDSSFRFSKESSSCAEISKNVYWYNNPQEPGEQDSASSSTFCPQRFKDPEYDCRPCASGNGFYKILQ